MNKYLCANIHRTTTTVKTNLFYFFSLSLSLTLFHALLFSVGAVVVIDIEKSML